MKISKNVPHIITHPSYNFVKVKFALEQAMKAQSGSTGVTLSLTSALHEV
jgi:hypothetical protein